MQRHAFTFVCLSTAFLLVVPAAVCAEPPGTTPPADAVSGGVGDASVPGGQSVTSNGPFETPVPVKKPASQSASAVPSPQPSARPRAVSTTPARERVAVRTVARFQRRARGGLSRRVAAAPPARGGGSSPIVALPSVPLQTATSPAVAPGIASREPRDSTSWWLPPLIAVGLAAFLVAVRLITRGLAIRRSDRRWARHFDTVPAETAAREASQLPNPSTPRRGDL